MPVMVVRSGRGVSLSVKNAMINVVSTGMDPEGAGVSATWTSSITRTRCLESAARSSAPAASSRCRRRWRTTRVRATWRIRRAGNNEVHIQLKLKQTDAKILQAIEEALWRIEKGTYGVCRDCGEPIAEARLSSDSLDEGLHHLQGKAELVTGLLPFLQEFYREKLAMMLRHQAAARLVGQYDVNNTYQYIVAREEAQLSWVAKAIRELGGNALDTADSAEDHNGQRARRGAGGDRRRCRDAQAFVDRWRPRVDAMSNARHRGMLRVILGETLEQKRFFEQALAGRTDLLGRRADQPEAARGEVLPNRWIE